MAQFFDGVKSKHILAVVRTVGGSGGGAIEYETTAPTANNPTGLKMCVLSTDPVTKYTGWLYVIVNSPTQIKKVYLDSTLIWQLPEKLNTPSISLSGDIISWNAISNATWYYIYVDGSQVNGTSNTSFDLSAILTSEGTYSVQVKAHSSNSMYLDSNLSNTVTYEIEPPPPVQNEHIYVRWSVTATTNNSTTTYSITGTRTGVSSGLNINYAEIRIQGGTLAPEASASGTVPTGDSVELTFEIVYAGAGVVGTEVVTIIDGDEYTSTWDATYDVSVE